MAFPQALQNATDIVRAERFERSQYIQYLRSCGYTPEEIDRKISELYMPSQPDLIAERNKTIVEDLLHEIANK